MSNGKKDLNKTIRFDEVFSEFVMKLTFALDITFADLVRACIVIAFPYLIGKSAKTIKSIDLEDIDFSKIVAIASQYSGSMRRDS